MLQAFYVNDTFFVRGSDAPIFLCVGGEGPPLDGTAVTASVHCNVAVEFLPQTKALMFAGTQDCTPRHECNRALHNHLSMQRCTWHKRSAGARPKRSRAPLLRPTRRMA